MQAFYRHGYRSEPGMIGISNLPIPRNPGPSRSTTGPPGRCSRPGSTTSAGSRGRWRGSKSPGVSFPLHFGLIRLDFDGDGRADEGETLWKVYGNFNRRGGRLGGGGEDLRHRLRSRRRGLARGYCHVLSALTEALLAHDFEELLHRSGFLLLADGDISIWCEGGRGEAISPSAWWRLLLRQPSECQDFGCWCSGRQGSLLRSRLSRKVVP